MKKLLSIVLSVMLIMCFAFVPTSAANISSADSISAADDESLAESESPEQQDDVVTQKGESGDPDVIEDSTDIDSSTTDSKGAEKVGSYIDLPDQFVLSALYQSATIPVELSDDIYEYQVNWESDSSAFHVSSYGYIWSESAGACTVTASVPSKGVSDSCTVILYPTGLSPANKTIGVTESFTCSLGVYGNKGVTYSSSNTNIATVTGNGVVTARAKGTCNIIATFYGRTYKSTVTAVAKLNYTSVELYKGEKFKLKVLGAGKVKWKSSKKSVVSVSSSGVIKGKKFGKATITAKANGKTYKCKVKVVRALPDFGAYLYDYNTRSNVFKVKFRNLGPKTVTITSGIKVKDVDYKVFDRKVKLKKKVKIKPGKTKYVKFYVVGKSTWYDYEDFTLYYKFKYDGKTYEGHVWDEDSVFKWGKKGWYSTYDDEDWYNSWY